MFFKKLFNKCTKSLIILLLIYLLWKQPNIKESKIATVPPYLPKITNDLLTSKEAYSQMTLTQKQIYLRNLFGFNSVQNAEQKNIIERKVISQLSTERQFYFKQNNEKQLSLMSENIQSSINLLQHPNNCSNARILFCPIDGTGWGFGFLLHQICFCLIIAIESGRTAILNNDEAKLFRFDVKWNELFDKMSNCSFTEHVMPFGPAKEYLMPNQSDRILTFTYRSELILRGADVAPMEIKDFLLKYHSNPILWFHGQVMKYIWRENERIMNATNKIVSSIPFECGPVVGIHVRRTDKKKEAKLHNLEEYMKMVDFWFDVMEEQFKIRQSNSNSKCSNRRMIFIAADLPVLKDIIDEANSTWGDKYELYHGTIFQNNYESIEALVEILAVYRILAKCQFLVCTFSSNTCLLIYSLMQAFQGDVVENAHSLDYPYGMGREFEATTDYSPVHEYPMTPEELWAEKGDRIIILSPIHQDGYIRGRNIRLNTEGNFPIYLLKKYSKFTNFSGFSYIK